MCGILYLLLSLALAGFVVAMATYAFFWYETANGPHLASLKGKYGKRLGRVLVGGVFSGFISSLLTMLFYPLGFLHWERNSGGAPESGPPLLILIHGLYHNSSAWTLFRRRLHQSGFTRVRTVNYSSFRHDFWQQVVKINQQIVKLADKENGPVVIIGHSLGGVLARACLEDWEKNGKVVGLITLGSPHQGSKLAVWGCGPLARSIVHRSPVIQELESRTDPAKLPRFAFYSPLDNMVLPNEALKPSQPGWTSIETDPISHVAMLYHRGTAEMVVGQLRAICHIS